MKTIEEFGTKLFEEYLINRESINNGVGTIYQSYDDWLVKKLYGQEKINEENIGYANWNPRELEAAIDDKNNEIERAKDKLGDLIINFVRK